LSYRRIKLLSSLHTSSLLDPAVPETTRELTKWAIVESNHGPVAAATALNR